MIKVMSLMKRKEGMEFAEFRKWLLDEHVAPQRYVREVRRRGFMVVASCPKWPVLPPGRWANKGFIYDFCSSRSRWNGNQKRTPNSSGCGV